MFGLCLRCRPLPSHQCSLRISFKFILHSFKGSVQRKLRWVENNINRSILASDCGAEHSFVVLFGFHLGFTIFPFPVSTVQIIGKFWKNR
jgi:hypothetical protein